MASDSNSQREWQIRHRAAADPAAGGTFCRRAHEASETCAGWWSTLPGSTSRRASPLHELVALAPFPPTGDDEAIVEFCARSTGRACVQLLRVVSRTPELGCRRSARSRRMRAWLW